MEDLQNVVAENHLSLEILSMDDVGWNLGEIEESGNTLEENSYIKAKAMFDFCFKHGFSYPIIADDAGLFAEAKNIEPGIFTGRYADAELALDDSLPKYYSIIKLLNKMENLENRKAYYKAVVTLMMPEGSYQQFDAISYGFISREIIGTIKKPYFYSVFILDGFNKTFNLLTEEELKKLSLSGFKENFRKVKIKSLRF